MSTAVAVEPKKVSLETGHTAARHWATAALAGIIAISATNAMTDFDKPGFVRFVRLVAPLFVMVMYARVGYRFTAKAADFPALRAAHVSRLADSLYFLGFLWTLWALIDSFVIHELKVGEAVFRTFGYALVTTGLGMFLRLLLVQFQHSDNDVSTQGDLEIGMELHKVSTQLSGTAKSLDDFRTVTNKALDGWTKSLERSKENVETSAKSISTHVAGIEQALINIRAKSDEQLDKRLAEWESELKKRVDAIDRELAQHLEKRVDSALDQFVKKVAPSLEKLDRANGRYTAQVDAAADAITRRLASIGTVVDRGREEFQSAASNLRKAVANDASAIQDSLTSLAIRIQHIRVPQDAIERAVAQQTAIVNERLITGTKSLEKAIDDLSRAVRHAAQGLKVRRRHRWWPF